MITSTTNERVKLVRALSQRKTRKREGRFVIEGVRLAEEAYQARVHPDFVFYTADLSQRGHKLVERWHGSGVACLEITPGIMRACAETDTPQGLLAVLPFAEIPLPRCPGLCIVVDRMQDPGNLGSLLRTSAAAGADAALLAPDTVDAYNPKVVRAGMGAHFHFAIRSMTWQAIEECLAGGVQVWLADANGELPYTQVDWTVPSALIVGSEAEGASPDAQRLAAGRVRIPLQNQIESLNVAAAAAVILFKAAEQRGFQIER